MKGEQNSGASRRERLTLTVTALVPGALGTLSLLAASAGRLGWLGAAIVLPVGLLLCRAWESLGERELSLGLRGAFGTGLGKCLELLYLLWALFLTAERAGGYARRLMATAEEEPTRWLFLGVGLALCLWLCRGLGAVLARTGKLFFLAVAVVLVLALVLTLPGADWKNLWPPRQGDLVGLPMAAITVLSLSGYGIFALCLPRAGEDGPRPGVWTAWGCLVLTVLVLAVVGAFGPVLAARMEEPFLLLLQGVQVPGAFQRGEAALISALALADWALLALLTWGTKTLWRSLTGLDRGSGWFTAGAFLMAGLLPRWPGAQERMTELAVWGNLILGVGVPMIALLLGERKRGRKTEGTFCGRKNQEKEDMVAKEEKKKR